MLVFPMISNIQLLRAFAAINVVIFHIISTASSYSQATSLFRHLEGWGANGVDIFFVISGFVMLYTQLHNRKSPLAFFQSRVLRIVPIYWALTLFILFLYLLFPAMFREMIVTPIWVISSLLFMSSVFAGEHPVVYVGWTLEWEMLFYLVFAIGLLLKSWRAQGTFVVLVLAAISVATQNWIVLEFLFGMVVAYLCHKRSYSKNVGLAAVVLGLLLLTLSLLPPVRDSGLNRVLIWGIPSLVMVFGAVSATPVKSALLSYLGDASYSIYLVQMLVIPAFYKCSSKLLGAWHGDLLAVMCLVASVTFGCFVYAWIERPMGRWLKAAAGMRLARA